MVRTFASCWLRDTQHLEASQEAHCGKSSAAINLTRAPFATADLHIFANVIFSVHFVSSETRHPRRER